MTYAARGTRSSRAVVKHSRRAQGGPEAAELTAGRCSITSEHSFPSAGRCSITSEPTFPSAELGWRGRDRAASVIHEVALCRILRHQTPLSRGGWGDRRHSDPAELRKGEGEIENTRLSIISLRDLQQSRDDCCGHTPRPRTFVVVDHRKKQKGLAGLFGWLKGACHRASMLIPRTCARA